MIEDGRAMLVMGGGDTGSLSSTQIVKPGQPTQPGTNMTGWAVGHCSTTLLDGAVIVTGGLRPDNPRGSARTEVLNTSTGLWILGMNMRQRRFDHSCTQVWVTPDNPTDDILTDILTNSSVLTTVVAGGKYSFYIYLYNCISYHRTVPG